MKAKFLLMASLALVAAGPAWAQRTVAAVEMSRDAMPENSDASRVETVRADLARPIGVWTGVRSCADTARARAALRNAFDRWIGQQTMARPGKRLITYGWDSGRWWYRNERTGSGRRKCKGGYTSAPVYARFY